MTEREVVVTKRQEMSLMVTTRTRAPKTQRHQMRREMQTPSLE
jgi:hypothetical protein